PRGNSGPSRHGPPPAWANWWRRGRDRCGKPSLAPDLIHRPLGLDKLVAIDAVAGLFVPDAVADQICQVLIAAAAAKHGAGVPFDGREQTVADLPFRGET